MVKAAAFLEGHDLSAFPMRTTHERGTVKWAAALVKSILRTWSGAALKRRRTGKAKTPVWTIHAEGLHECHKLLQEHWRWLQAYKMQEHF